ncbi:MULTISPECIES: phytanoyl-CoA dioxygenase family protein [unclassified Terrabacter]|uniref:phytanoyl-CoA dioxygenase family protein n=1 Tax=unclassified Terrabacter TaxID=2630222 RepID=UPI000701A7C8|nr:MULTISPECIES: phytanoyl-CoA dioxygenase family protein [unclassified Terrabacter]KRB48164.1 phytanoyl-CoA dioxygenase [Terrabacter sp. Root181]KRF40667.1 phytanoyl-CoA dioxygenase [Terrabacter sp. Soil810]
MPTDLLPALTTAYPVSDDAVAAYRTNGHVRLTQVATQDEAAAYRGPVAATVERLSTETRPLAERDSYGMAFLQVMNLWRHDEAVARFVMATRFADVAARLLGVPRVRLYHDQALFKEPGGGYTPWHQDAMYWPLDGSRCLTMWMPLVDITPAHGGLAFASGSHVDGPLSDIGISDASEEHFDGLVSERGLVVDEPVAMRAGDASFHSGWTVHKALGNSSSRMREVMTVIWFADGLSVLEPANPAQANDLASWLPGLAPGDVAASPANPVLTR